jgi:hypothetical protein
MFKPVFLHKIGTQKLMKNNNSKVMMNLQFLLSLKYLNLCVEASMRLADTREGCIDKWGGGI